MPVLRQRRHPGGRLAGFRRRAIRFAAAGAALPARSVSPPTRTADCVCPRWLSRTARAPTSTSSHPHRISARAAQASCTHRYVDPAVERIVQQSWPRRARNSIARNRRDGDGGALEARQGRRISALPPCTEAFRMSPTSATHCKEVEPVAVAAQAALRRRASRARARSGMTPTDDRDLMMRALATRRARPVSRRRPILASVVSSPAARRCWARVGTSAAGEAHAEVRAIEDARIAWKRSARRDRVRHARALQPSWTDASLHDALLAAGIARVVAAMHDPSIRGRAEALRA